MKIKERYLQSVKSEFNLENSNSYIEEPQVLVLLHQLKWTEANPDGDDEGNVAMETIGSKHGYNTKTEPKSKEEKQIEKGRIWKRN